MTRGFTTLFFIWMAATGLHAETLRVEIPSEKVAPPSASVKTAAIVEIESTTLGLRPNRDRAPANAPTNSCNMHASQLVWAPNLIEMIETEEFTTDDFVFHDEVTNEPVEFAQKNPEAIQARLRMEKKKSEEVISKFREFEELFQDLYLEGKDQLNDPEFERKEWLRAEYWVRDTFAKFNPKQRQILSHAMGKWIRLYFKSSIKEMPSDEKRIVVKRIQTLEAIFNKPSLQVSTIFCFDKTENRAN